MIKARRYIAGDSALVKPRLVVAHEAEAMGAILGFSTPPGKAWTVTLNGEVLGCGGLIRAWEGRYMAWTWCGDVPFQHRGFIADTCAAAIADAFEEGARRVEGHAPVGHVLAHRFMERLGFKREGVARCWGADGSDYVTYARTHATLAEARRAGRGD